ncbi:hypothetical protein TNCV_3081851 [Trichonephila clavipes]|nr:hypothetical protein TNCV_3081851 [Trichonephila clavipes]
MVNEADGLILLAANSTKILTYRTRCLTLDLGLKRKFNWSFLIADILQPILGADFLESQKVDKLSPHQQKHLEFIRQFTTDIKHITGYKNSFADALSHIDEIAFPNRIDFDEMAREQLSYVGKKSVISADDLKLAFMKIEDPVLVQVKPVRIASPAPPRNCPVQTKTTTGMEDV